MSLHDKMIAAKTHIDKVSAGFVPVYWSKPDTSEDYFSPLGYVSWGANDIEVSALKVINHFDKLNDCELALSVQWDFYEVTGSAGEWSQLIDIIYADYTDK